MSERSLLMPGECGRNEALFLTANNLARQACQTCVQLNYCGQQTQEIAAALRARGYGGETVIAGERVTLGSSEALANPYMMAPPAKLTWNLEILPEDPAQALQVLRNAHLTAQLPRAGVMPAAFSDQLKDIISKAFEELRQNKKGYTVDSPVYARKGWLIARSLFRQSCIANPTSDTLPLHEEERAKDIVKLYMESLYDFGSTGKHPGVVALYYSRHHYLKLLRHFAGFLPVYQIRNVIDKFPRQAYEKLEERVSDKALYLSESSKLNESVMPVKPRRQSATVPVRRRLQPPMPSPKPPQVPQPPKVEPKLNSKSAQRQAAEPASPTPQKTIDEELAALSFAENMLLPNRIDALPNHLRAAVYIAYRIRLPYSMQAEGWGSIERLQASLGVSSFKEIMELATHKIMPKVREGCRNPLKPT